jgi:phage gp36-like protein
MYSTNSDIETRIGTPKYITLTDDSSSGVADEMKVTQAREWAEAEMNSYLARRYAVPVSTSGSTDLQMALRSISVDLAVHRLYERKPPMPDDIRRRRDAAIGWLAAVVSGAIVLPGATELASNPTQGPFGQAVGRGRILTEDELEDL